jgi:hypothetical protein
MIDSSFNKIYLLDEYITNSYVQIEGITNFDASSSISYENTHMLGGVQGATMVNAPYDVAVNIERSFIQKDFIFNYTGINPIKCAYIDNGTNYFTLKNLYLTSYTAAFSVGDLPKISSKFTAFSQFPKQQNSFTEAQTKTTQALNIPKLCSMFLSGSNDAANFVLKNNMNIYGFEYSLNIKRQPYYNIGSSSVSEVCPILPIEMSFSVSSKIKNESDLSLSKSILSIYPDIINFDMLITGSEIIKFPIRNAKITSINKTIQAGNIMDVKTNFMGYYGI